MCGVLIINPPIQFSFHGKIMGGKNSVLITRTGHRYPNKTWAEWRDRAVSFFRNPLIKCIEGPAKITVQYWNGDKRRRDIPAMVDSIYHCLEKSDIVKDDSLFKELHWLPMGYDKKDPRVIITIEELNDA